ncbi:MAG: hypothetical protein OXF31_05225 [Gammaproteobacteria bacterium]|nr:hypothetical protein [Gammaproteobacteria bacterium]
MNHPQRTTHARSSVRLGLIGLVLLAISAHAQSPLMPARTMGANVLVLPANAILSEQVESVPGTRMSIVVEGDFRVYRARHKGKDHQVHVALDGPARRLAFDLKEGRFRDVLPSLRIEMDDYADFDTVVAQAGGTGGKIYEALGFALISLPDDVNPAEAAAELSASRSVTSATIQLQGPLYVPM